MTTNFSLWDRETLERFAREVADENRVLKKGMALPGHYPQDAVALAMLANWAQLQTTAEGLMQAILGAHRGGPLARTMNVLTHAHTEALSRTLGDRQGWLKWYLYENRMGAKGLCAGNTHHIKPIRSLPDLLALVQEGRSQ